MSKKQGLRRFICIVLIILLLGVICYQYISVDFFSKKAKNTRPRITILNTQSYPKVGGLWTVSFKVEGTADLIITAVEGTTWSQNNDLNCDIIFQQIKNEQETIRYIWKDNQIIIKNFSSNDVLYEISKVQTLGKHVLKFSFGDDVAYAYNDASNWWNNYWGYRKKVTVNNSQIENNQQNFPLLFNITDTDLKDKAQVDGDDIVFISFLDNSTKFYHEIEYFDNTTGQIISWINLTQLSSDEDTYFWMYYGNSNCSNQQNPSSVWNTQYTLVHHFNESSNPHNDSTINENDGNQSGGVNQAATGIISGANQFDGIDDYILINDSNSLDITTEITLEAWIRLDTLQDGMIIGKENAYRLWFDYRENPTDNNFIFEIYNGTGWEQKNETLSWSTGSYYYVTGTFNRTDLKEYRNGSEINNSVSYVGSINPSDNDLYIGSDENGNNNFSGIIDELRISKTALNNSWINTTYNTIVNQSILFTISNEESAGPLITNPTPADEDTTVPKTPSFFEITVFDPNPDLLNITWRTNASGTWETFNETNGSGNGVTDGTYQVTNTSWASVYSQPYWWSVNVSDGTHWTNQTFQFTLQQYTPTINSFIIANNTGNKSNNKTGRISVLQYSYFLINITDTNGWEDIDYINITCWYDNGDDSVSNYYNKSKGGNINMFLQYQNTTATGSFKAIWPSNEITFSSTNCSETIINETTRLINISFQPNAQFRYAISNNTWNTTINDYNDPYSWNVNCSISDSLNNTVIRKDEFGVNWYSSISATEIVEINGAPGMNTESSIMVISYSCNYDYHLFVYMDENFTQVGGSDIIEVSGNLTMLENADADDELTVNTTFTGIGDSYKITLFNTNATNNGTSNSVDVQFELSIPFGTWGRYTSTVVKKIQRVD